MNKTVHETLHLLNCPTCTLRGGWGAGNGPVKNEKSQQIVAKSQNLAQPTTVNPGQAFCPRIKIWFCCSKFEFILCSNFSTVNRKMDFSSQTSISIVKFASITEQ